MLLNILNEHYPIKVLSKKEIELERKPLITKGKLTSTHLYIKVSRTHANTLFFFDHKRNVMH